MQFTNLDCLVQVSVQRQRLKLYRVKFFKSKVFRSLYILNFKMWSSWYLSCKFKYWSLQFLCIYLFIDPPPQPNYKSLGNRKLKNLAFKTNRFKILGQKFLEVYILLNFKPMDLVDTLPVIRYWSEIFNACTYHHDSAFTAFRTTCL